MWGGMRSQAAGHRRGHRASSEWGVHTIGIRGAAPGCSMLALGVY